MPENNEPQYELDKDYAPLGIVDAADGSGTTWPEFVGQVNKMDNQVAALTEDRDSRPRKFHVHFEFPSVAANASPEVIIANYNDDYPKIPEDAVVTSCWFVADDGSSTAFITGSPCKNPSGYWFTRVTNVLSKPQSFAATLYFVID